ncbi:MAG: hypothetical protein ABIU58_11160 [Ramlibacter sp.]
MDTFPASAQQAAQFVWWASLALGVVVSVVVALLLWLIVLSAKLIEGHVSRIWDVGQRVANNTVHITALFKTNEVAAQILATAVRIDAGAAAIETHARGCPGCPQCMLKH